MRFFQYWRLSFALLLLCNGGQAAVSQPNEAIISPLPEYAQYAQRIASERGLPVFAPVVLPDDPTALVAGGLAATLDWPQLQAAGARRGAPTDPDYTMSDTRWQRTPLGVINLVDERDGQTEYRVATPNFFALTHYNRSYFYAAAVADLAQELAHRRNNAGHITN